MDEIAMDVRGSKKTAYENFRSKENLFAAVFMKEALTARNNYQAARGCFGNLATFLRPG